MTLVAEGHVPDAIFEEAKAHFSEEELVNLTMAVVTINGWNRWRLPSAQSREISAAARKGRRSTAMKHLLIGLCLAAIASAAMTRK